jgi:hypothetical protein
MFAAVWRFFTPILPKRSGVGNMGIGAQIFKLDVILFGCDWRDPFLPGITDTAPDHICQIIRGYAKDA